MSVRNCRKILPTAGTIFLFCALLLQPELASTAVIHSMKRFTTKLVPVLFPYMVLSHFFVTYRMLDPLTKCLGLHENVGSVFLIGHLCGYPMGAKMTGEMVGQGRIDTQQAAMLCALSSGASPAFLIHGVGYGLWHNSRYGIFLLATQFSISIVGLWVWQRRSMLPKSPSVQQQQVGKISFVDCFCHAIRDSTQQTLYIGGYIVFFSLLTEILVQGPFPERLAPMAASILEFSTGTHMAAEFGGYPGLFCTGFAVGFGGLSVLSQTAHLLGNTGISLRPYVIWKLIFGCLNGFLSMVYGTMNPELLHVRYATGDFVSTGSGAWLMGCILLFVILWHMAGKENSSRQ